MAIPESQLETWSHQGAVTTAKNTYASIKANLQSADASYAEKDTQPYLQGSYGNDTNIYGDSDVDVVFQLNSTFHRNLDRLPPDQVEAYRRAFSDASYHFSDFRQDVATHLQAKFGYQQVISGNKSLKLIGTSGRLAADIIVCCQYRDYQWFRGLHDQRYDEGIYFKTSDGHEIVNYPKRHLANCSAKHQSTGNCFKPTVRILKNMRSYMVDQKIIGSDLAPSYFIEGMLYNVPDDQYNGDFSSTFCNCVNWLVKTDRSKFVCPSGKHSLFGSSSVQWDDARCAQFLDALVNLWNRW